MRVFVTGATGFIGSAIVPELIGAGHRVLGMARSDAGAKKLADAGAEVHRADLDDLASVARGAAEADGVIHAAFNHDFSTFVANCEADARVIAALGGALAGTKRPLVITSGTGMGNTVPGEPALEDNAPGPNEPNPRVASERAAVAVLAQGVNASLVRLPQVHDPYRQGLISYVTAISRERGRCVFVGDGANRWPAVHVRDAARLYRLALEAATPGARYHAVGEEGVAFKDMAEVVGRGLKVPVVGLSAAEAAEHYGWLGGFVGRDVPASSARTRERLAWRPTGPGIVADLEEMRFF